MVLPHTWLGKSLEVDLVAGLPCRVLLLWVLVTPVQFGFGARFYRRAYRSLKHGGANMDVLVRTLATAPRPKPGPEGLPPCGTL